MAEDFIGSIKEIEQEAEAIINQGRKEAARILEDARKQANEILSRSLPMDEVKKEQERILQTARTQAETMIDNARRQADIHRQRAEGKINEVMGFVLTRLLGDSGGG